MFILNWFPLGGVPLNTWTKNFKPKLFQSSLRWCDEILNFWMWWIHWMHRLKTFQLVGINTEYPCLWKNLHRTNLTCWSWYQMKKDKLKCLLKGIKEDVNLKTFLTPKSVIIRFLAFLGDKHFSLSQSFEDSNKFHCHRVELLRTDYLAYPTSITLP